MYEGSGSWLLLGSSLIPTVTFRVDARVLGIDWSVPQQGISTLSRKFVLHAAMVPRPKVNSRQNIRCLSIQHSS